MSNQQALLDFLTYSYFKIVPKEIYGDRGQTDYSDYCIKKAIMKAYEDATNEGAYNTLFKKTIGAEKLDELKAASVAARKASAKFLLSIMMNGTITPVKGSVIITARYILRKMALFLHTEMLKNGSI